MSDSNTNTNTGPTTGKVGTLETPNYPPINIKFYLEASHSHRINNFNQQVVTFVNNLVNKLS